MERRLWSVKMWDTPPFPKIFTLKLRYKINWLGLNTGCPKRCPLDITNSNNVRDFFGTHCVVIEFVFITLNIQNSVAWYWNSTLALYSDSLDYHQGITFSPSIPLFIFPSRGYYKRCKNTIVVKAAIIWQYSTFTQDTVPTNIAIYEYLCSLNSWFCEGQCKM